MPARGSAAGGRGKPMYTIPIPDRKAWQKLRDDAKVPKGASKVSIGADIEAVYKTFAMATLTKNLNATKKLIDDLDKTYIPAVKKKYQDFEPVVTRKVKNQAVNHKKFVETVIHGKAEFYPAYQAVESAYNRIVNNRGGEARDLENALDRLQAIMEAFALIDEKTWKGRRQGVNRLKGDISKEGAVTPEHQKMYGMLMKDLESTVGT
jgi:hypothetical protein